MKIFKEIAFKWWQFSLLKWDVLILGIVIGANWPNAFVDYTKILLIIFVLLTFYLMNVWIKKVK